MFLIFVYISLNDTMIDENIKKAEFCNKCLLQYLSVQRLAGLRCRQEAIRGVQVSLSSFLR